MLHPIKVNGPKNDLKGITQRSNEVIWDRKLQIVFYMLPALKIKILLVLVN